MDELGDFSPAWWLRGPHLQTVGARLLRRRSGVSFGRERLTTPDDDFLDLDYPLVRGFAADDSRPLVLVLHGLEGSARSKYAVETYRQLAARGAAAVGLNFRSCSGELNRGKRLYHSGETADLAFVIEYLEQRFPGRPLAVIGFSLGGNALLKYLGETGESTVGRIRAVATVSVPFDLAKGARYIDLGFSKIYQFRLLRSLRRKVRGKSAQIADLIDYDRALRARTFWEFDDAATAPLHGFAGADDYYARCSSRQFLGRVRVPTLLIQSRDDPFVPAEAIPSDGALHNAVIKTKFFELGGHVGFVSGGTPWKPVFWAEREAARFVCRRLKS